LLKEETQQGPSKKPANPKWVVLAISGACAGIACLVLGVVLVGAVLSPRIGGVFNQIRLLPNHAPESTQIATMEISPHALKNANYMGDPKAPVKMIEYADFQCPYCRLYWQDTEPRIIQSYVMTGKVYYEYRSVGAFIGQESAAAAEATYCAGDQGKFWEFHDTLFTNWTGENVGNFTPAKLRQYASTVGLNPLTFYNCVKKRHSLATSPARCSEC